MAAPAPRRGAASPASAGRPGARGRGAPALWLWGAYIVLFPFYLFQSGTPKPADWLMVLVFATVLSGSRPRMHPHVSKTLLVLGWFVIYAAMVNWTWSMLHYDSFFLVTPLFYAYNFLLFYSALVLFTKHGERFLRFTSHGVAVSVLLQVGLALSRGVNLGREELFFNNPNQLGYFAVLSATLFLFGTKRFRFAWPYQALIFGACLYLGAISLSKAAIVSLVILGLVATVHRPMVALAAALLLWGSLSVLDRETALLTKLEFRFSRVASDDTAAGRGYDRIVRHPEHVALGAGEGGVDRFETEFQGEFHSTLGTALFSYGVIGFGLLLAYLYRLFRKLGFRGALYLLPIFVYGLTHNGLRFSLLWATLAVAYASALLPPVPQRPRRGRLHPAPVLQPSPIRPPRSDVVTRG